MKKEISRARATLMITKSSGARAVSFLQQLHSPTFYADFASLCGNTI